MKKIIILLFITFSVICVGQTKKSKNKTSVAKTTPTEIKTLPYEVGDIICTSQCCRWEIHGWGNSDSRYCIISVKASVEKVTKDKIQINVISSDRNFINYKQGCPTFESEVYNLKYNDLDLVTDKLYWIDPNKFLTWNKCE